MTQLSQLFTASTYETRHPHRESEREYFTRLARERKIERRSERRRDLVRPAALLLVPAALAGYCVYLHEHYGDAFAFVHSEGSFWLRHVPATGPLGGAWDALRSGEQGLAQIVRHLPAASGAPGSAGKRVAHRTTIRPVILG